MQYPVAPAPGLGLGGAAPDGSLVRRGLSADAPNGRLYIDRPRLPDWLERVEVLGMRIGEARLDLVFTNRGGVTATEVPRKEGEIEVLIRQ